MRVFSILLGALTAFVFAGIALGQTTPVVTTPETTNWVAGTGPYKGAQIAVLLGDPSKTGMYVMRLKLPAGTSFAPHVHGQTENVTVISGTVWFGMGKKADQSQMKEYPAGTFVTVPADFPHYAMVKEDTVVQIEGMGPETMTPIK